jgi:hypothetical protein
MPVQTTTVSGQQNIPPELMPFFTGSSNLTYDTKDPTKVLTGNEGILQQARKYTTRNYDQTYGDALAKAGLAGADRVASISPMQEKVGSELNNLSLDTGYGKAKDIYSGLTNADQVSQYMNPYTQLALNPQIRQATENARINSIGQDRASARAGSYGGARNILAQQQANKTLQQNLSDIVGKGYNTAYDTAMKTQLTAAQGLTDTATRATGANLANLQAKSAFGDLQRNIQQEQLSNQYQDVMRKADFPMEQVGNMSNILRGVPIVQTGGSTVTTTPQPSFLSQLIGGGQALLGYNQLNKT